MPQLDFDGFHVLLTRRPVRALRLRVRPDGSVHLSAPARAPEATLRAWVQSQQAWIAQHQATFRARPQPAPRRYATGETHYYQGRAYHLRVVEQPGRAQVALAGEELVLRLPAGSDPATRQQVLERWYRAQLHAQLPGLLARWEPVVGAQAAAWGIKRMRTRWGTCSVRARRIWLSLELAQWPLPCLEYVLVHELTHLHERLHSARFWHLLAQAMPEWRGAHEALKRGQLAAASGC